MKELYILKIGGSIVTEKDKKHLVVRRDLLVSIGRKIASLKKKKKFDLIIIHGAGSAGHTLAKEYGLDKGVGSSKKKKWGALKSRVANQFLDKEIAEALVDGGLEIAPVHTSSVIIQKNAKIAHFDLKPIRNHLKMGYVPMMYGDMVLDETLNMSVCSGDAIVPFLALKLSAKNLFYASDVDGIFDSDPYANEDALLIEEIHYHEVHKKSALTQSHNTDVTGGLFGKISKMADLKKARGAKVEIFGGFDAENYANVLAGKKFPHTTIYF